MDADSTKQTEYTETGPERSRPQSGRTTVHRDDMDVSNGANAPIECLNPQVALHTFSH